MNEARNMKRRRVLCLVAGVALLAAAFLVWPRGPKEPVYQGKALTQWSYCGTSLKTLPRVPVTMLAPLVST